MEPSKDRCETCRFSEPTGTATYGLCRINPPGPVPYTEYMEGREVALAVTGWPQVDLISDWCGEWEGLRDENDLVKDDLQAAAETLLAFDAEIGLGWPSDMAARLTAIAQGTPILVRGDTEAAEIQASPTYGQLIPEDRDEDELCGQQWRQPGKRAGYIEWRCGRPKHHSGECRPEPDVPEHLIRRA